MNTKLSLFFGFVLLYTYSFSQNSAPSYPKIGDTIQDYVFTNIINHDKKTLSISDFRGQWLVLDAWNRFCGGCIESFSAMNKLQKNFQGKARVVMLGSYLSGKKIEDDSALTRKVFLDKLKKLKLDHLTSVFDSTIIDKYDIPGFPHIILVDPKGVIVAKMRKIDSTVLSEFINGGSPHYVYRRSKSETSGYIYDVNKPLLTNGANSNGGVDTTFAYRSLMMYYNPKIQGNVISGFKGHSPSDTLPKSNKAEIFGYELTDMLRIAHTGYAYWGDDDTLHKMIYPTIVIDSSDARIRQLFKHYSLYAYSLITPPALSDVPTRMKFLKQDLERFFQIETKLEKRDMLVYKFIVRDSVKLNKFRSKTQRKYLQSFGVSDGFDAVNIDVLGLIQQSDIGWHLARLAQTSYSDAPPLRDETNINFGLDVKFRADQEDMNSIIREFNRMGLDLVKTTEKINCIVVKNQQEK